MSKPIKYYYDLLSQPSRAMYMLLKLNNVPFEDCAVPLRKGAQLTEEFKDNVNRFQKVPCIIDNDYKLSESIAILRYLDNKKLILDKWYPSDIKKRGAVDEYLEWQHNNTRITCGLYFTFKWRLPLQTGQKPDENLVSIIECHMENVLDLIENVWLESNKFLTGSEITAADIFGACEVEQPRIAGYDPRVNRPKLSNWLDLVRNATNPYYDETHKYVNLIAERTASSEKSKL